jgi:hypothetical protein
LGSPEHSFGELQLIQNCLVVIIRPVAIQPVNPLSNEKYLQFGFVICHLDGMQEVFKKFLNQLNISLSDLLCRLNKTLPFLLHIGYTKSKPKNNQCFMLCYKMLNIQ